MITQYTRELAQKLSRAQSTLELAILQDMDTTARRMGLDTITTDGWNAIYWRGLEEIKSPSLDALRDLYRQYMGARFFARWTSEKGWD